MLPRTKLFNRSSSSCGYFMNWNIWIGLKDSTSVLTEALYSLMIKPFENSFIIFSTFKRSQYFKFYGKTLFSMILLWIWGWWFLVSYINVTKKLWLFLGISSLSLIKRWNIRQKQWNSHLYADERGLVCEEPIGLFLDLNRAFYCVQHEGGLEILD